MEAAASSPRSSRAASLGLFLLSCAILSLEVLHTRILSAQMWYHHAFVVVTMAMLGFAAAGTVATVAPSLTRGDVNAKLSWSSLLFGLSVVMSQAFLSRMANDPSAVKGTGERGFLLIACVLLLVPYFFGGLVVTLALSTAERLHSRYFANLVGSALGAWLFIVAIRPLGAERLLVLCAAAGPLTALCFGGAWRRPRIVAVVALAAAGVLFVRAPDWFAIDLGIDKRRHLTGILLEKRWTPLCRLDLYADSLDKPTAIHIVQDGGAGTRMQGADSWRRPSPFDTHEVAYAPHLRRLRAGAPGPDVLVIGIGGGVDLKVALENRARSVLGIEINPEIARLTRDDYATFCGNLAQQPGVSLVEGEGRSTLRRLDRKFDLIQLAGADTYTAGAVSSFVLSESYLYTTEALRDYFDHLTDTGTLGIIRFLDEPDRETVRLFGMALLELRRRGVEKPSRHAVVVQTRWSAGTVFSRTPFAKEDLAFYGRADEDKSGGHSLVYSPDLSAKQENAFTRLAAAVDAGKEEEFYASYHVDTRPVGDDSPFYFNFHHFWDSATLEDSAFARAMDATIPVAPSILRSLLLEAGALVVVLVLAPLWILRRGGLRGAGAGRSLAYFSALGVGFMLLEMSSIQRLALFLGHPTYALTVVLFSFLFFAGIGSWASGRFLRDDVRATRTVLLLLAALIGVFTLAIDRVTQGLLQQPLPLRIAAAVACLAPMNLLMGVPFPRGLARLRAARPELIPWAIGVNGAASVLASIVAIVIAMEFGFKVDSLLAIACYIVACVSVPAGAPARTDTASAAPTATAVARD
jgi:hypothetical protein